MLPIRTTTMKKLLFTVGITALLFFLAKQTSAQDNTFRIPESARQISENTYYLGNKTDPTTGKKVEGYIIVERGRSGSAKPDHAGGPKDKGGNGGSSCYGYIANGAFWKNAEPWVMNASNTRGLDHNTVFNIMQNGIQKWEDAANYNIIGNGTLTTDLLVAETSGSPDGTNEVYFADITDSNAIGVTIVWGIFGGRPSSRQIVEWDQIYDDVDYDWSAEANGVTGKMDFDNIATHELGHTMGMADLYELGCNDETMYGYGATGETYKRDLGPGDIAGISKLY